MFQGAFLLEKWSQEKSFKLKNQMLGAVSTAKHGLKWTFQKVGLL